MWCVIKFIDSTKKHLYLHHNLKRFTIVTPSVQTLNTRDLSSSVFRCNKESGTTCTHSKTANTETYWSHEDVTSCNNPKCEQIEGWIAIVQWIWRRRRWIWSVLAVHPNVPSNKPCEQEQIQNTIYKFCRHRLVFIHVNVIFVSPSSLTKNNNGF